ncbi:hypothetical protein DSO57_1002872 [Entomophthora muscae]|uniref:Uncharacterized protein n=1 Tax=Entomophthora muscae TaxID=34485 RepID=A0ACC2TWG1_9FUNG|nr:hypothetical protein DSO57_1002872 [Entomophthora muscae]
MWYPPKACSSDAVGFVGHCLEHFCRLSYQSKALPSLLVVDGDVLLARGIVACLCAVGSVCPAILNWLGTKCWCQMLVVLAFVHNQMDNDEYKLVASLVPLSTLKHPHSTPSCHFIPYLPADNAPSTGTSGKTPGDQPFSSGSRRHPSE